MNTSQLATLHVSTGEAADILKVDRRKFYRWANLRLDAADAPTIAGRRVIHRDSLVSIAIRARRDGLPAVNPVI